MLESLDGANPGSYKSFIEQNGFADGSESLAAHSNALRNYRLALAASQGVSLEELHKQRRATDYFTAA